MRKDLLESGPPPSVRRRVGGLALAAVLASALSLSACGGSSKDSTSSSSSASTASSGSSAAQPGTKKATGEPIKVMTLSAVNTQGPAYKNVQEAARVYGDWINDRGGINGRPLKVELCDTKGTVPDAVACARKAVASKDVSVVGSFDYAGDAIMPVLRKAGISWFGACCAISASELTSPNAITIGNGPLFTVGLVSRAKQDGCKRTNLAIQEGAEVFKPPMLAAAKRIGLPIGAQVTIPAKAQDYSPQVAQATSNNADCILTIISETSFIPFMGPFEQSGSKARMYGPMGNLDEKVAKGHEQVMDGDVISGSPDRGLPIWKDYNAALKQYNADPSQDYNSLGGLGTWAGYLAFTQIAEKMKGPITAQTFLSTARKSVLNLPGFLPPNLDLSKTWGKEGGPKGYEGLINRCAIFSQLKGGKQVPLTSKWEDVSELAGGTKPMKCS